MLDKENEEKIQSISNTCMNQLSTLQESHNEDISNIQSKAEQCLQKEYLVYIYKYSSFPPSFIYFFTE